MYQPEQAIPLDNEPSRQAPVGRTIELGYGARRISMPYDPDRLTILAPKDFQSRPLTDDDLNEALTHPIGARPLEEIVHGRDRVLIVVPDATRAAGASRVAPLVWRRLTEIGLADNQISVLVGGGIHRPPTDDELRAILGPDMPERLAVHAHDANDRDWLVALGVTSRGTPVELNRRLLETDHVLVIGSITFHYFAGFSGGRKAILPGCASERSIRANHLLSFNLESLEKRAGVTSGQLDGNPVHEDMEEAVHMLNPSFLVNTVLNASNEIVALYAGDWRAAHRRGCTEYAASHVVPIENRRPLVVVSCGGAPRDLNLIQSHKAMEHASMALTEGGTMIALAECSQGLGRPDFMDWFVPGGSRATALQLVDNYQINGQTAWGLRKKAERFRLILISSLQDEVVKKMGLEPYASLESALADVPFESGYIMPGGLTTLPSVAAIPAS